MTKKKSYFFFFFFLFFSFVLSSSFDSNFFDANVLDSNAFDLNGFLDANAGIDSNFVANVRLVDLNGVLDNSVGSNFFDLNYFVRDFNLGDFNNSFDLNVSDSNFVFDVSVSDLNAVDSNYLSDANNIVDSNISSFSLNFFAEFLNGIASLFSKFGDFIGLNKFFGNFVEVAFPQDKNFELKEKEIEINGQKAKCFGVACDSLPEEVK